MENNYEFVVPEVYGHNTFCVLAIKHLITEVLSQSSLGSWFRDFYVFSGNIYAELMSFADDFCEDWPVIIVAPERQHPLFLIFPGYAEAV